VPSRFSLARIVEIAVGYLTLIGFLFYPIGVLVLSLQIWDAYSYNLLDSLYAASLVPIATAAGRVGDFLFWALLAMTSAQGIAHAIGMPKLKEHEANILEPLPEAERERLLGSQDGFYKYERSSSILVSALTLTAPFVLQLILFDSWRTWMLYISFVVLCCVGGVAAGLLTLLPGQTPLIGLGGNWKAHLVAYAFGILAGIALAGTSNPALPLVEFESAGHECGRLLAHKEGYWYVFDSHGTLRAVSDDTAGGVTFLRNKPQPASR
jgi:hypothetical protein